jgi:hypothetical protein
VRVSEDYLAGHLDFFTAEPTLRAPLKSLTQDINPGAARGALDARVEVHEHQLVVVQGASVGFVSLGIDDRVGFHDPPAPLLRKDHPVAVEREQFLRRLAWLEPA